MTDVTLQPTYTSQRDIWGSMWAGARGRCPQCREKTLYASYLKPAETCNSCGEELHHHRADDAPAYFTIFIIGHILIPLILYIEMNNYGWPLWLHAALWLPMALALTLLFLPVIKGTLIGLQWGYRMHGFGTGDGVELSDQADLELLAMHDANETSPAVK